MRAVNHFIHEGMYSRELPSMAFRNKPSELTVSSFVPLFLTVSPA
jgi:hypothetical protein